MTKNIATPAFMWDNAPRFPENYCNYKCISIHMCLSFVCTGPTHKTEIKFHTEPPKNGLDKIISSLRLIFGSTPCEENNWNQSLPVTMNTFLTPLYWNFGWLYLCKLVQLRFEGARLIVKTFQKSPFLLLLDICFGVIVLLEDPGFLVEKLLSDAGHYIALYILKLSSDFMMPFTSPRYSVLKAAK